MSTTTLVKDADSRHEALDQCELKIAKASRDTVESIRVIGHELIKIETEALHEAYNGCDFKDYVEIRLRFDYKMARVWMRACLALDAIDAEKLQLPYNQSQVIELAKLSNDDLLPTWMAVLDHADKERKSVTYELVKAAVDSRRTSTQERHTRVHRHKPQLNAPKGIDVDLGSTNGEAVRTSVWSEEGERALNRIRRLCGDAVADAIDRGQPKITESDLLRWADEEDEMVKNLAYWMVIGHRWTLRKALQYEETSIDLKTTVGDLADRARARGGEFYAEFPGLRLKVEIVS